MQINYALKFKLYKIKHATDYAARIQDLLVLLEARKQITTLLMVGSGHWGQEGLAPAPGPAATPAFQPDAGPGAMAMPGQSFKLLVDTVSSRVCIIRVC